MDFGKRKEERGKKEEKGRKEQEVEEEELGFRKHKNKMSGVLSKKSSFCFYFYILPYYYTLYFRSSTNIMNLFFLHFHPFP